MLPDMSSENVVNLSENLGYSITESTQKNSILDSF